MKKTFPVFSVAVVAVLLGGCAGLTQDFGTLRRIASAPAPSNTFEAEKAKNEKWMCSRSGNCLRAEQAWSPAIERFAKSYYGPAIDRFRETHDDDSFDLAEANRLAWQMQPAEYEKALVAAESECQYLISEVRRRAYRDFNNIADPSRPSLRTAPAPAICYDISHITINSRNWRTENEESTPLSARELGTDSVLLRR